MKTEKSTLKLSFKMIISVYRYFMIIIIGDMGCAILDSLQYFLEMSNCPFGNYNFCEKSPKIVSIVTKSWV